MKRNFKALGLAMLAAFALSAVVASAASAHTPAEFTSGSHWTVLTADPINEQVFTEGETSVSCGKSLVVDSSTGTTATTITAEPTYGKTTDVVGESGCTLKVGASSFPLQVHTNDCHYLFTAGNATDGEVHITCPEGKAIEVTARILGAWRKCMDIGEQTPTVATVDYTNGTVLTSGKNVWDVTLKFTMEGMTYTKTSLCGSGTFHNQHYVGEVTITGHDTDGTPLDVTWDKTVN